MILHRADRRGRSRLDNFCAFAAGRRSTLFVGYEDLWEWSVSRPGEFWQDIWDFFDVPHDGSCGQVVSDGPMWSKRWLPRARLNYAEHALLRSGGDTAIYGRSHTRGASELSWDELRAEVARCTDGLRALTGKRLEVPIKRIFQGEHARAVVEASAVSSPQSLAELEHLAASRRATTQQVS
jgi:hypothetical protein